MKRIEDYRIAHSAAEAMAMKAAGPGRGVYLAGGTDLFLQGAGGDYVVDISRAGLDGIAATPEGGLLIGAAATLHALATTPSVTGFAGGAIASVAAHCGNRPVRSTATLGGNLCNALPSADLAPVLLALDAACVIAAADGKESIPLSAFFVGPRRTVLDGRLLTAVELPASAAGMRCGYRRLTRSAEDIALVQVAAAVPSVAGAPDPRLALGAVAPVPMRALEAESHLRGPYAAGELPARIDAASRAAADACSPLDDHRASAEYRRDMVRVLTRRLLTDLLSPSEGGDS